MSLFHILFGTALMALSLILLFKYRPVKRDRLVLCLLCFLSGVFGVLSAEPVNFTVAALSLVLPLAVAVCFCLELRREVRARNARKRRLSAQRNSLRQIPAAPLPERAAM